MSNALVILPAPTLWCDTCGLVFEGAVEGPPVTVADIGAIEHEHAGYHLQVELGLIAASWAAYSKGVTTDGIHP